VPEGARILVDAGFRANCWAGFRKRIIASIRFSRIRFPGDPPVRDGGDEMAALGMLGLDVDREAAGARSECWLVRNKGLHFPTNHRETRACEDCRNAHRGIVSFPAFGLFGTLTVELAWEDHPL
jgi:hypothetical protein